MSTFTDTRKQLLRAITQLEAELAIPDGPFEDGLWRLGQHDTINGLQVQVALLNRLIAHPEQQTSEGLNVLLRSLFAEYDALHARLAKLPNFDHVGEEEEVEVEDLPEEEREQYEESMALYHELFVNQYQHELVAGLLGIEEPRRHDLMAVIGAHYESQEIRRVCKREDQARYYSVVKTWIEQGGDLTALDIPDFHAWMREEVASWLNV